MVAPDPTNRPTTNSLPARGLAFTGERFVPGVPGEIWVEHWHRYHFAARWATGLRVLDVACGEGYGTALLSGVASEVTGVDISADAVAHATRTYASLPNARFACAPCTRLPLADASVDLAVSFETVEHIAEQQAFLAELDRVLAPGGVLVLSCPNKLEYSDKRAYANAFHVKELYRAELAQLVGARFPAIAWYGQRPSFFSVIAPDRGGGAGQLLEVDEANPAQALSALSHPLYFLVVASRAPEALAALAPAVSVLVDRGDWVHHDYEKVMRMLGDSAAHGEALATALAQRDLEALALGRGAEGLRCALAALEEAKRAALEGLGRELAARDAALVARDAEIARRGGLRWWLALPLARLARWLRLR